MMVSQPTPAHGDNKTTMPSRGTCAALRAVLVVLSLDLKGAPHNSRCPRNVFLHTPPTRFSPHKLHLQRTLLGF